MPKSTLMFSLMLLVTPRFCTYVHGAKSKGDVHYFRRQHDPGLFFFSFFYTTFSHPRGGIVINDEHDELCNMANYLMTLLPIHTLGCFFSRVNYLLFFSN